MGWLGHVIEFQIVVAQGLELDLEEAVMPLHHALEGLPTGPLHLGWSAGQIVVGFEKSQPSSRRRQRRAAARHGAGRKTCPAGLSYRHGLEFVVHSQTS